MEVYTPFVLRNIAQFPISGSVSACSPSNIALVKYWGKHSVQLPENPSVSFTLQECTTTTTLTYKKITDRITAFDFEILYEGIPKPEFKSKIHAFFERIMTYVPWIKSFNFRIDTQNTFPHSSGIASSASGMSAIAYCLMEMERMASPEMTAEDFNRKGSYLARLGSGSACRSLEGPITVWGKHPAIVGSSDFFAVKYPETVHPYFQHYHDTILLIDKGEKQVSSSVGHKLMHGHPFAPQRFEQAAENIDRLKQIFEIGDRDGFIEVVEREALTLHAMMMTSLPYFVLMKPNTLSVIHKVWEFREATGSKLCFTLDAGANVHLLYPEEERIAVMEFITGTLVAYCQNGHYICDKIGLGAKIV